MQMHLALLVILSVLSTLVPAPALAIELPVVPQFFSTHLRGSNEVQPVETDGRGLGFFILRGDDVHYRIVVFNLSSAITASHFHLAPAGTNGPVQEPILFAGNKAVGVWENLTATELDALLSNNIYVNVHTTNHPGGEIRGQVQ